MLRLEKQLTGKNKNGTKSRQTGIDLLKCISMAMVIVLHINTYGLKNIILNNYPLVNAINSALQAFSVVGVNCFVLITGCFLSRKTIELNLSELLKYYKRLLPLWIQVVMYSIGIFLVLCIIPGSEVDFSIKQAVKQLFVIFTGQYWFFSKYFLLIIISPFLNRLINSLSDSDYKHTVIVLVAVFSIFPMINVFGDSFEANSGYSTVWFAVLYMIAGYIRRIIEQLNNRKMYLTLYLSSTLIIFIIIFWNTFLNDGVLSSRFVFFSRSYNSILVLLSSVFLFILFVKLDCRSRKVGFFVSNIARLSFGVYLLHEHPLFRDILWRRIIGLENYADQQLLCILVMILTIVLIYLAGILIEFVRQTICGFIISSYKRVFKIEK